MIWAVVAIVAAILTFATAMVVLYVRARDGRRKAELTLAAAEATIDKRDAMVKNLVKRVERQSNTLKAKDKAFADLEAFAATCHDPEAIRNELTRMFSGGSG